VITAFTTDGNLNIHIDTIHEGFNNYGFINYSFQHYGHSGKTKTIRGIFLTI
jgi:hypothetical protein